jgi:hypothetical protein
MAVGIQVGIDLVVVDAEARFFRCPGGQGHGTQQKADKA